MNPTLTIAKREFKSYFDSPLAYVVICLSLFLLGVGVFIWPRPFWQIDRATLAQMFEVIPIGLVVLIVPVVTMRLVAEEKRSGTLEMLITLPVRDSEVILGKFLGCVGFYAAMLALTFTYPIILIRLGKPEMGPIFASYLGLFLFGASFVAIGLLASALSKSQVVGFVGAFVVLLFLFLIEWMAQTGGGWLTSVIRYIGIQQHLENFGKGIIDTKDVIYYLSVVALCLLLSVRAMQAWKWR